MEIRQQIKDSFVESLPAMENFKEVVKSAVETILTREREEQKKQINESLLESLPATEKFKGVVKSEVQTVITGEREGLKQEIQDSLLASLSTLEIFKGMVKDEVQAALAIINANQDHEEAEMFSRKLSEKSKVEKSETKLQERITETLNVPTFMSVLVGFHTIVSQQPLRTHKELQLLIALMVVIVLGTLLYLYSVWLKLASLKSRVTSLGAKRRALNGESVSLVNQIMAPGGLQIRTESHQSFIDEMERDSTLRKLGRSIAG
ncbi:hypothetical protein C5167_048138 [Papaver somniferum]|uniref:Uncharacterized protein n=1 Tax=Papaver somniferum TaxID=3469 RepID=A0A4Y7KH32_PAPSO|nr:uncharacterized protein LOC113306886 [Papaver somniferum]XP_026411593.1 uncharacterized protein LOC113306886 [Papaver somniferum]RZC72663.1 hypothetical protein C5167_048138 [Papaver somniferum]